MRTRTQLALAMLLASVVVGVALLDFDCAADPRPAERSAAPSSTDTQPARVPEAPAPEAARSAGAPPAVATEAPPPAAVAVSSEASDAELQAFAGVAPPGALEGIVLRGRTPVTGGRAWIGGNSAGGLPWGTPEAWDAAGSVRSAPIDGEGRFHFEGLVPDDYAVGVRAEDGATRRTWVHVSSEGGSRRVRIVLGGGGLRGHAYDDLGGPRANWHVAVNNWGRMLADEQLVAGAVTDASGAFEFSGLTGGSYIVTLCPTTNFGDSQRRIAFVELPVGEWRTVDFGAAAGASHVWSGGIVTPRGAPLRLEPPLFLIAESDGVRAQWPLDADAQFRLRFTPGVHRLALEGRNMQRADAGELAMPAHDLQKDLAVPRCLLRIRATYSGPSAEPARELARLAFALKTNVPYGHLGQRAADGHTYFFGLPPGEHVLVSPGLPITGVPGGELRIQVLPEDDELEVDVVVGGR